jgi:hypothetical protein
MFCNARTRNGGRCRRYPLAGRHRCRLHGGVAGRGNRTPRTPYQIFSLREGRKRWLAARHAQGLKATGGRPRKWRPGQLEREMAKAVEAIDGELEGLPAIDKPAEAMTSSELLAVASRFSLLRLLEAVRPPLDFGADVKERRLVIETAEKVAKLRVRVAEAEFQKERGDRLGEILAKIAAADLSRPSQGGK